VEWAAARGVFTHGFNMLGFPTETQEDARQTISIASNFALHTASFFTVTPFPNTDLYHAVQHVAPEKLAGVDYRDMEFTNLRVNLSDMPDEVLFRLQRQAQREFYLRPRRLWRILRDHPSRCSIPRYGSMVFIRAAKGLLPSRGQPFRNR